MKVDNIICFNAEDIENTVSLDDENLPVTSDWQAFTYENMRQEHNFKDGSTLLYVKTCNDQYELLYESSTENGLECSSFFSKDSAYILNGYNPEDKTINSLVHFPKKEFISFANKQNKSESNLILRKAFELISPIHIFKHATRLIVNGKPIPYECDNKILEEYRSLFIKYKCSTAYIPISCILEELLTYIHDYIASGTIDMNLVNARYSELQSFGEVCDDTASSVLSFINNPASTNLRNLCEELEKKLSNVDNLLHIYLSDELSYQTRGEEDACK